MKFCGRCDQPIREGERYTKHPIAGSSYGGDTVYRHVAECTPVPIQTTQDSVYH
ncbi:hypothetical protein ACIBCS_27700 [Streptomyces phaeochromogenes]|uniref:hypothetical protein n=1 Tax=Streptomyces phaeochromogenes TaxID=1923 RepID=UPI0033F2E59F